VRRPSIGDEARSIARCESSRNCRGKCIAQTAPTVASSRLSLYLGPRRPLMTSGDVRATYSSGNFGGRGTGYSRRSLPRGLSAQRDLAQEESDPGLIPRAIVPRTNAHRRACPFKESRWRVNCDFRGFRGMQSGMHSRARRASYANSSAVKVFSAIDSESDRSSRRRESLARAARVSASGANTLSLYDRFQVSPIPMRPSARLKRRALPRDRHQQLMTKGGGGGIGGANLSASFAPSTLCSVQTSLQREDALAGAWASNRRRIDPHQRNDDAADARGRFNRRNDTRPLLLCTRERDCARASTRTRIPGVFLVRDRQREREREREGGEGEKERKKPGRA